MNKRDRLRRVYAKVPRIKCKGLCTACCGPLGMTPMEKLILDSAAGHDVHADSSLTCSALVDGRCSAYEARPLICRLWGVADAMPCEHGCEIIDNDGKPLNVAECLALTNEVTAIDPRAPVWTLPEDEIRFVTALVKAAGERK